VFYAWKEKFIQGGKQALTRSRRNGDEGGLQAENERLKQLIGELTIANDAFKKILQGERRRWWQRSYATKTYPSGRRYTYPDAPGEPATTKPRGAASHWIHTSS
jgi:hypothetical protein